MLLIDQYAFLISAIEFLGAMICTIAIAMDLGYKLGANMKVAHLVRLILLFTTLSLITDGVSYIIDLNLFEHAIILNEIILFVDYVAYMLAFLLMYIFVILQLPNMTSKARKKLIGVILLLVGMEGLVIVANLFTGVIYYVDAANEYVEGAYLGIFTCILFGIAVFLIGVVVAKRREFEKGDCLPLTLSLCMLVAGGISEILIDDFPGTNFGIAGGILFIYWIYRTKTMSKNTEGTNGRNMLIIMYLFLGMTFAIFVSYIINVSAVMEITRENSKNTSETVASMVNESIVNTFIKPITVAETMSQSSNLKNAILLDSQTDQEYVNEDFVDYLDSIREGMDYQMVYAVSELNKKYYTYEGISKIVDTENDIYDIWYKDFIETGKDYELNIDTDEANNWSLSVFVNKRIENDGKLIGVCGIGVSIDILQNLISEIEEEYGIEVYTVNPEGLVQLASSFDTIENLKLDNSYFDKVNSKNFYYERLGETARLTIYDDVLDWYIVVVDDNPDKISVAKAVRPGLFAAIISILLMLVGYIGVNRYINRVNTVLVENKKKEDYLVKVTETDELTGLLNRHAYEKQKKQMLLKPLSDDLTVIIFDVNCLKMTNDNIGHEAGDELIKGTAKCIVETFGLYGNCYRVGGDEFIVFANISDKELQEVADKFRESCTLWHGNKAKALSVSVGYADVAGNGGLSLEELIKVADDRMYVDKDNYYKISGKDRRKS